MRPALLALALLLAPLSFADNFILFDRFGAYWAPIEGGPVTPIFDDQVAGSASDGDRVLIARFAGGTLRTAVYDEGDTTPINESLLTGTFDHTQRPIVVWDGTRYVVFWMARGIVNGAAFDATGVLTSTFELPEVPSISGAASNGNTIAVIRMFASETHAGNAEVILLDAEFHIIRRTLVGSIIKSNGFGHTFLEFARITAFGSGYYAAWQHERSSRYRDILGTRITADGTALDVVPSTRELHSLMGTVLASVESDSNTMYELELFVHRARVLAIMKRTWGRLVTATAIDAKGVTEGPVQVGGKFEMPTNAETIVLRDGTLALSWFELNRVATINPFRALSGAPRRRSVRH
ncbi:MAG TPA: hypothetical protein VEK79_18355 [Thermoanaerobaculia bacterium]|nr:hypothetical protein [Thermoanaerobaculia bacterium]